MKTSLHARTKAAPAPSFRPVRGGLLQRKCACSGTPGPTGECEACRKKREKGMLQRKATHPSSFNPHPSEVPPIVHEVLRSPGQPLDAETRAFMEPRFGHDFSNVRIHTDAQAADSARAVNARAYTVGRRLVFGARQFNPTSRAGKKLIAHELAHSIQQGSQSERISEWSSLNYATSSKLELEADHAAERVNRYLPRLDAWTSSGSVLQRQKSDDSGYELPPAGPIDLLPGITREHTFAKSETVRHTPECDIRFSLSLIGNVTLGPAHSIATLSKNELSVDFEKFGTNLTFTVGKTLEDLQFKSIGVNFGPYKGSAFAFKPPRSYLSSTKLPKELILGRSKVSGELRIELEAEIIPNSPAPKSVPQPVIDPKAIFRGALAGGLFLLSILGLIAERAAAPVILFIPPVDDFSPKGPWEKA